MARKRSSHLDRLFARVNAVHPAPYPRDAWQPAWKPRGRWWMRARGQASRMFDSSAAGAWQRLARPARAA